MAVGYVGKAFVLNSVAGLNAVVPTPSAVAPGHKMYCFVGSIGANAGTVTIPDGWKSVLVKATGTALRTVLCTKIATSADVGASHTWVFPSSGRTFGYAVAYSGINPDAAELFDAVDSVDPGQGPWPSPSLSVGSGDWVLTFAVGRQNPGTAVEKAWTNSDGADVARYNLGTVEAASINITAALWDSARGLAPGSQTRTVGLNLPVSQSQVWSVRVPLAAVGGGLEPGEGGNPWSFIGMPMGAGGVSPVTPFIADGDVVGADNIASGLSGEEDVLVVETSTTPSSVDEDVLVVTV